VVSKDISNALALLTTYEGKLPIGAPTSPVLSNFICLELDDDLIAFCKYFKTNGLKLA
jgi:RNA-directed DNA polymerase